MAYPVVLILSEVEERLRRSGILRVAVPLQEGSFRAYAADPRQAYVRARITVPGASAGDKGISQ